MAGTLRPGRHYQLYMDALPKERPLEQLLGDLLAMDPSCGVVFHGFPQSMGARFDPWAAAAKNAGLPSGAAFGLDGTSVSAEHKGDAVGDVASRAGVYVTLIDCESHYDSGPTRVQEMIALGQHARAKAPDALFIAQPWPMPLLHSGFPYEQENAFCDANAPQYYYNDWRSSYGAARYAALDPKFDEQWRTLNSGRLAHIVRPMLKTIQSEGWDDVIWDLITCLLANPTVIVWCDRGVPSSRAFPTAVRAIEALTDRGHTGARAVWDFQVEQQRAGAYKGRIDGKAGAETLSLLGIKWSAS
ncbi:MAG: hypothetical protein JNK05_07930 [Myxococcales bacterium]|nr:hypothetical protein [Myxococcales bacterium]